MVIFSEGTRAPAGQMLPFKGGIFVFAIQEQVPVVPVALQFIEWRWASRR